VLTAFPFIRPGGAPAEQPGAFAVVDGARAATGWPSEGPGAAPAAFGGVLESAARSLAGPAGAVVTAQYVTVFHVDFAVVVVVPGEPAHESSPFMIRAMRGSRSAVLNAYSSLASRRGLLILSG